MHFNGLLIYMHTEYELMACDADLIISQVLSCVEHVTDDTK